LPAVIWAAVGAVTMHVWRRYRTRMNVLRWEATHNPIAIAAQDALFGKIEVLYNGYAVPNLFLTSIDVVNESHRSEGC